MGAWGPGLYADDFALDLKATIAVLARLPFPPDRLLALLIETAPQAANDPSDDQHSVFWLVAADQFARKGIDCPTARDKALDIIANGSDLVAMAALGMEQKLIKKRAAALDALRVELSAAVKPIARKVLKGPEKFIFDIGDVYVYPVCGCKPIDRYGLSKSLKDHPYYAGWKQDGWGAIAIADRGLLFDHLAWYVPMVINERIDAKPTLADLLQPRFWIVRRPGGLTARQRDQLKMENVGRIDIDRAKFDVLFPDRFSPQRQLINHGSTVDDGMHLPAQSETTLANLAAKGAGWVQEFAHVRDLRAALTPAAK